MELNRQPIGLTGQPTLVKGDGIRRSIYNVDLSDTPSRAWRSEFNRAAPTAPDAAIRARGDAIRFEAIRETLQSRLADIRALIQRATEATGH
jgi:hypothetical protein